MSIKAAISDLRTFSRLASASKTSLPSTTAMAPNSNADTTIWLWFPQTRKSLWELKLTPRRNPKLTAKYRPFLGQVLTNLKTLRLLLLKILPKLESFLEKRARLVTAAELTRWDNSLPAGLCSPRTHSQNVFASVAPISFMFPEETFFRSFLLRVSKFLCTCSNHPGSSTVLKSHTRASSPSW